MVAHFTTTYATSPPLNPTPDWLFPPRVSEDEDGDVLSQPFSPAEVVRQFRRMNNTALGVDGLTIKARVPSVRASLQFTHAFIRLRDGSASLAVNETTLTWDTRKKANTLLKTPTQQRHLLILQQSPDQGRAAFSTSLCDSSNFFINSGAFLPFPQYRFVLKARLNLLLTRTVQARSGSAFSDTRCRNCHQHPETLAHLVNHCHHNLGMVRERHNTVLERVIRAIPPSLVDKYKEQPLPNTTGANRPDLTIISSDQRSVILLDVCIPFEGHPQALQEAAHSKLAKYEPLRRPTLGTSEAEKCCHQASMTRKVRDSFHLQAHRLIIQHPPNTMMNNAFRIRFPSQTTYQCPVCELWYNILPSLRRHVKKSHPAYLYQELFACDVCGYETGTLKSINSHVKTRHGTINPPVAPNGAFQCPHCVMCFPSKVSCSQHVRGRHMDEACQARANAAANLSDGKRKTWDPVEVDKFKSALLQFGPLSNVAIANAIGTRTCKQVGVFKRSFLLKNPTWLVDNTPPVPYSPQPPPYSTAVNSNSNLTSAATSSSSAHQYPSSPPRTVSMSPSYPSLQFFVSSPSPPYSVSPLPPFPHNLPTPLVSPSDIVIASIHSNTPHTESAHATPPRPLSVLPNPCSPSPPSSPSVPAALPLPPLPPAYSTPSTQKTDGAIDVNATIRAPFYKDVLAFYGHQLDEAEWDRFCATLLRWAETLRSATASSRSHTPHPTAGWARRRNQHRRPPPPSLIEPTPEPSPSPPSSTARISDAPSHHRAPGRQRDVAKARKLQRLYRSNPSVCVTERSWTTLHPRSVPSLRQTLCRTLPPAMLLQNLWPHHHHGSSPVLSRTTSLTLLSPLRRYNTNSGEPRNPHQDQTN
ncbi:hypothetical protein EMCRGX_G005435 [Ephydatia muelleri]